MLFARQQTFFSLGVAFFKSFFEHMHDHIVPHARNNYHPHLFGHRAMALFSVLLVSVKVFSVSLITFGPVLPAYSSAITRENIINLTNQSRQAFGLAELKENAILHEAAQTKANDMLAKGYFSHTAPDGKTPWDFIVAANYNYLVAGENLAVNFSQAENVEEAWMNSPGHKANILNHNFEEIGIGIAEGEYQGKNSIFVVQMFGTASAQKVALAEEPTPVEANTLPGYKPEATNSTSEKVAGMNMQAEEKKELEIINSQTIVDGLNLEIKANIEGYPVKVFAVYGEKAAAMTPKADGTWEANIAISKLAQNSSNLEIKAYDIHNRLSRSQVASFAGTTPENYKIVKNESPAKVGWMGRVFDPKQLENKLYLGFMTVFLTSLVIALAVRRHIQHISVVANGAFVVMLACLLWVTG